MAFIDCTQRHCDIYDYRMLGRMLTSVIMWFSQLQSNVETEFSCLYYHIAFFSFLTTLKLQQPLRFSPNLASCSNF